MIFSLQSLTQTHLSSNINATVAAVPYLRALYSEDVLDAFEYRSLTLFDVNTRKRYEHEPNVAYAGYGLGLCHNYSSYEECDAAHPTERILSILYTRTALGWHFRKLVRHIMRMRAHFLILVLGSTSEIEIRMRNIIGRL
jgi:hypothetical protein